MGKNQEKFASTDYEVDKLEKAFTEQLHKQRKVRIRIPSGRGQGEMCPVPVGLNGTHFLIARDEDIDVPEGVLNVLEAAVEEVPEQYEVNGNKKIRYRKANRYPVTVLGYLDENGNIIGKLS